MEAGDYVLATKYSDGCPHDQWCVGFYDGEKPDGRHRIVDDKGQTFRIGGFRRVGKVTEECGRLIIGNINLIQSQERSLWSWKKFYKRDLERKPEDDK